MIGSRQTASRRQRLVTAAVGLVALWAAAACQPIRTTHGPYRAGTITPDGEDHYLITPQGTGFDVSAPTSNTSTNLRRAVVLTSTPLSVDQQACATWPGPSGSGIQPGLVLRAELAPSYTRAIMVTNNVLFGARTGFNVHVADSRTQPPYTLVGQVTLPDSVGPDPFHQEPLPWRLCARVQARHLELKVWPTANVAGEPAWNDPTYTRAVTVPANWVIAGQPGVYVGHLARGESTRFRDLSAGAI